MIREILIFLILILSSIGVSLAQTFEKIVIEDENGVYNGDCRWFDFDNDHDLDFIITGQVETNTLRLAIYENKGESGFEQVYAAQGFSETGLEFVNLDHDQDVDFMLMGRSIGLDNDLQTYQNEDGDITIVDNIIPEFLTGGSNGTLVYADINNDLLQDIFITGINGYEDSEAVVEAHIYWQNEEASFTYQSSLDDPVYLADAVLVDVDNDHDLDLFISGNDNTYPYQRTELHLNSNGSFSLDESNAFTQLQNASIDVGDFDNDGDPDIIITGLNASIESETILYKNTNGIFSAVEATGLSDHHGSAGSVMWGDFDDDGDLDLLLGGNSAGDDDFELMVNQGDGTFDQLDESNFENLSNGSVSWGDYDGDGDLDILATGFVEGEDPQIIVYRNDMIASSPIPEVPDLLTATYNNESVTLSWDDNAATRSQSSSGHLSYNLHVENMAGDPLLYSFSDLLTGYRKVVEMGNMGYSNSWTFHDLDEGTYLWRVQSISPAFRASSFSEEGYFFVGIPQSVPSSFDAEIETQGIYLSWVDINPNEEYFIIERKVSDESVFSKIDSTMSDVVSYTDKAEDLAPSFNATYQVYAKNPVGSSDHSATAQIWHNGKPTDLTIGQIGNGVALTWEDHSFNEKEFIIERKIEGEDAFVAIGSVNRDVTVYIDENKADGFTATYRVYAANEHGESDASKEESITILNVPHQSVSHWSVFPNPASHEMTIKLTNTPLVRKQARLLNTAGRTVRMQVISGTTLIMNVADLPTGIYYLMIEGYYAQKVIKH